MKHILLTAAMPEETQALLESFAKLTEIAELPNQVYPSWEWKLADNIFHLVQSGVGQVNAASAVATSLSNIDPPPEVVISFGTCGGLASKTKVGELIVGDKYFYGKVDATIIGYQLGQIPSMPAYYATPPELLTKVVQRLKHDGNTVTSGDICTSDTFFGPKDIAEANKWIPNLVAVDMESTALAQVAYLRKLTFISIRCVSDLAIDDAGASFNSQAVNASEIVATALNTLLVTNLADLFTQ